MLAFEANDLDASAAIDLERADALRREAAALESQVRALRRGADKLDKAAAAKRAKAAGLRKRVALVEGGPR